MHTAGEGALEAAEQTREVLDAEAQRLKENVENEAQKLKAGVKNVAKKFPSAMWSSWPRAPGSGPPRARP